jgi:thiol-disulfide isomerase/thioredoxin
MTRATLVLALLTLSGTALAQPQPAKSEPAAKAPQSVAPAASQPKAEKPKIYDEAADAKQQIAAAVAKARQENQRVLIQWGGNWCGWCHMLHTTFQKNADLKKELMYEYQLVLVDAGGKERKNMDLATSYSADLAKHGFPFLTVLDASGKPVANQETESLEIKGEDGKSITGEGAGHNPKKVLEFLKAHEATPIQASEALSRGMETAKASGRKVFLHFGAPWCGWCHKLEDWLAQDEIGAIFGKDYVDLKIDQDRMVGAKEIEARFQMPEKSGIPWFVIVDPATGKGIANSTGPEGNIGYPGQPEEIEHFMGMLDKTHKNLSAAELATLRASLEEAAKKLPH